MKRPRTLSLEAQNKRSLSGTNKLQKQVANANTFHYSRKRRLTYPFRAEKLQNETKESFLRRGLISPLKSIENTSLANSRRFEPQIHITKTVRFTPETKTWDGTRSFNRDFDELIYNFLERRRAIGDADILKWTCANTKRISALCILMADLLYRMEEAAKTGDAVPCLPKGGGKTIKVMFVFRPYLLSLQNVLLEAHKNAKRLRVEGKTIQKLPQSVTSTVC